MVSKKTVVAVVEEPPTKHDQTPIQRERRLKAKEFDALVPLFSGATPERINAARCVLVDGIGPTEAGEQFGLPKQRVRDIVDKVLRAKDNVPADWVRVNTWLPPAEADKAIALSEKCKAKRKLGGRIA